VMKEELGAFAGDRELTPELVERLKADFVAQPRVFERLRDEVPEFYDAFIRVRDVRLASAISEEEARGSAPIVAVVGLGHLSGVEAALAWPRA